MSQQEAKKKQRTAKQSELHKLKRERDKFNRYIKWFTGEDFIRVDDGTQKMWCRAFQTFTEGTIEQRFQKFWDWVSLAFYEEINAQPHDPNALDHGTQKRQIERKWEVKWPSFQPLTAEEFPLLGSYIRTAMKDLEVFIDPVINDVFLYNLWLILVPAEKREEIEFKSTQGDGYIFDNVSSLWKPVDCKQMQIHLLDVMQLHLKLDKKVLFTTEPQQKYWDQRIGDVSSYNGLLNILKGKRRYPNLFEMRLDKKEWIIPYSGAKVFDATTGFYRPRTKDDAFTQEASFKFVKDLETDVDPCVINDTKVRQELYEHLKGDIDPTYVITSLQVLCPNAMKLIMDTFTDLDRLWFILPRLGAILSGYCLREVLFIFGKGKGGKSTLLQTIAECLGDLGVVLPKASFVKNKLETGSSHKTDLKRASGRRFCLVDELESSDIMNETLMKNWASHQKIPMREIYGKQGEELLKSYLVMITNEPPRFSQEDPTIRERIRAVKGTTKYFDKDCTSNEKPLGFTTVEEWKDAYVPEEDTYWCYRTPEKEEFSRSFRSDDHRKNELGTLLCLLTHLLYKMTKDGRTNQLPYPKLVQEDSLQFFQESDVVATFIEEYYEDEKNYNAACSLKDVYEKFRSTFPELGIKSFTLQTFKRSLGGKNLLFPNNRKSVIKIKKCLKNSDHPIYYTT